MDGVFELLAVLFLRWRVGAATAAALLMAFLLAATVPPFGGRCGIAVVLLGFGVGLLWDVDASQTQGKGDAD